MPTPRNNDEWDDFWGSCFGNAQLDPKGELKMVAYNMAAWRGHQTIRLVNNCMELIMARGKKDAQQTPSNNRFGNTEFIDISILEDDWPEIIKTYGSSDVLVDAVSDLLEAGYRVGLSFNQQNDAFICAITCRDTESPNNGLTFNSFAETWFEALQIGMYKHYVKSAKNWRGAAGKASRPKFG